MVPLKFLWSWLEFCGVPWKSSGFLGVLRRSSEFFSWSSLEFLGDPFKFLWRVLGRLRTWVSQALLYYSSWTLSRYFPANLFEFWAVLAPWPKWERKKKKCLKRVLKCVPSVNNPNMLTITQQFSCFLNHHEFLILLNPDATFKMNKNCINANFELLFNYYNI